MHSMLMVLPGLASPFLMLLALNLYIKGSDEKPWPLGPILAIFPAGIFVIPTIVGFLGLLEEWDFFTFLMFAFWWPTGIEVLSLHYYGFSFG